MDALERMQLGSDANISAAIKHLARAAACEEVRDVGEHHAIWLLVRLLCHEFGRDVEVTIDSARRYAQQLAADAVNVV